MPVCWPYPVVSEEGGVCLWGFCLGVSAWGDVYPGVCASQHAMGQTPPPLWTEWLTDRYKNITLPQTLFAGSKNFVFLAPLHTEFLDLSFNPNCCWGNKYSLAGFPLRLENLEKWEGIFQSGKTQGILTRLEKSGKITQNTKKFWEF